MSRKIPLGAAVAVSAVTAAIAISLTYVSAMGAFNAKLADISERQAMYGKLSEIDAKVRQDYIGEIDETSLQDYIAAGYIAGLGDKNARYLTAEKYRAYLDANAASDVGIGVRTDRGEDGNLRVMEVFSGSAAEAAGIEKGDVIFEIDGREVTLIGYADAVNLLDGTAGTEVTVRAVREKEIGAPEESGTESGVQQTQTVSEILSFTMVRSQYTYTTVVWERINGNIGYIAISAFDDGSADLFSKAIEELSGAAGYVIDLRGNTGSDVEAMTKVLDKIVPAGNLVYYKDKNGNIQSEYTSDRQEIALPVTVIVDADTAGAGEIFAADIRSYQKGTIVGETTAGDSTRDEVLPLSDGSAVILSVSAYVTMEGDGFSGSGIVPDRTMVLTAEQKEARRQGLLGKTEDPQIRTGVTALWAMGCPVEILPE